MIKGNPKYPTFTNETNFRKELEDEQEQQLRERVGAARAAVTNATGQARYRYKPPPDYIGQEADTPDQSVSATTYGNVPSINEQATYGMSKPTPEQAAGIDPISQADKTDYSSWTQQGGQPQSPYNTDTAAVMPKLQVEGDPAEVYGVRHGDDDKETFAEEGEVYREEDLRAIYDRAGLKYTPRNEPNERQGD